MKKYYCLIISLLLLSGNISFLGAEEDEKQLEEYDTTGEGISPETKGKQGFKGFLIYEDKTTFGNHYIPSGWMGDYTDLKLDYGYKKKPYSGLTCIKIEYNARESQGAGWAGIFWQNPPNNWGEKKGGYNLTGATKLTFWARGEKGSEKIKIFKVGGISGIYPDSCSVSFGPVILRKKWRKYTINLKNRDLSYINGGFCWVAVAGDNPGGIIFYLDDILFE